MAASLAAAAVTVAAAPRAARAWGSAEHQQLGSSSYARACAGVLATRPVAAAVAPAADGLAAAAGIRARAEIACGSNLAVLAELYGDATALAGDFLADPSELLTRAGAWRFSSKKHYWRLALENSDHFNPLSARAWRMHHQAAVAHALDGARTEGVATVTAFEEAIGESAFADHFLQDSFASGHMGFNRPASSAGAAKAFHDRWNERGRVVTDRAGRRWRTYGDGRLDAQEDGQGRQHVLDAATLSIRHVLLAFVLGAPSPEEGLATWRALPFTIEAPEVQVDAVELVSGEAEDRELVPLLATIRPARKDTVVDAVVWSAAPFESPGDATVAALAGIDLAFPFLPVQAHLGAGGILREPGGGHGAVVDTGVLIPLGLSVDGLISHQLGAAASWLFWNDLRVVLHVEYQANVELGTALVSLHAGLAELLPGASTGWYGAIAFGRVFSAAGGGAF